MRMINIVFYIWLFPIVTSFNQTIEELSQKRYFFLQLKFVDAVNFAQILQVFFSFPSFFLYGLPFNRKIGAENSKKKIPLPFLLSHCIWKDIRITYIILNKALVPR